MSRSVNSYFYLQPEENSRNNHFIQKMRDISDKDKIQIYLINRPLVDSKYSYSVSNSIIMLSPNHKIALYNFGDSEGDFEEFYEEFIEDLGSISDRFEYKTQLGRPKTWKNLIVSQGIVDPSEFDAKLELENLKIEKQEEKRKCELLISLLVGSINDINTVGIEVPTTILDKVKKKIQLFDGDQTRFVYDKLDEKIIRIQGLSGTGKTELLLHKLKELYGESEENRIMFTCHNRILANSIQGRIPEFFNFMKVDKQIRWSERLWCVHAWGSATQANSGAYRLITYFYNIPFYTWSKNTDFAKVCKLALDDLKSKNISDFGFVFDYMLIDESQDFPEEFFELCSLVTKNSIYVAGDIFQSIFDDEIVKDISPHYLLSKCYRTDPRTLMFSHALGMGLYEYPRLRWLKTNEWEACGYITERARDTSRTLKLMREPLRRFEDLEENGHNCIQISELENDWVATKENAIISIIEHLISDNPTIDPSDIGIVFLDGTKDNYLLADKLAVSIYEKFNWDVNKAYESKSNKKNCLMISNKNNVKGLEFPFVICIGGKITRDYSYRNAIYMILSRSFITSYLVVPKNRNEDILVNIKSCLDDVLNSGCIYTKIPTKDELELIRRTAIHPAPKSQSMYEIINLAFEEIGVDNKYRESLTDVVRTISGDRIDYNEIFDCIDYNYKLMKKKRR